MLHLWPQGRIVRVSAFVLIGLITADLVFNGAIPSWQLFGDPANKAAGRQLGLAIVYTTLAAAVFIAGIVAVGLHKQAVQFLIEVEAEMVRVEWVPWDKLWRSTVIIALAVALLAAIILLSDYLLYEQFLKSVFTLGKHF